jgi:hypothetical protein
VIMSSVSAPLEPLAFELSPSLRGPGMSGAAGRYEISTVRRLYEASPQNLFHARANIRSDGIWQGG